MALQARMDRVIDAALGQRIVGCVVLVRIGGHEVYARAAGLADREAGREMERSAIFRLASVTKPIVALAALRLIAGGVLHLDDPVARHLPWFTPLAPDGSRPDITIHQLLTHTSGLTYGGEAAHSRGLTGPLISLEENMRLLAGQPLEFMPGSLWEYGMSTDVLGAVLAAVSGPTLADAVAREVTGPLGMTDTLFGVEDLTRLAVPYRDGRPPVRMGEPDEYADADGDAIPFSPGRILEPRAPQSGGAGMAGTADDVMRLLEAIRVDFLPAPLRDAALTNQIGDLERRPARPGKRFGYFGAVTADRAAAGSALPLGAVDWGGAWGHNWVIDPASETSLVVCTNTTFEGCDGPFRAEIWEALFG